MPLRSQHRVVVTGIGVISPVGNTLDSFWSALLKGECGIGPLTRFDASAFDTRIAGEVKNLDISAIDKKEARRLDLSLQFSICAAAMAMEHSGLKLDSIDLDMAGVVIGSGIGGIATFEEQFTKLSSSGPSRVSPFFIPMMIIDMSAGLVSMRYGFRGPNYATVSACATSAHAIADAFRIVQRGEASVMITGGTEATITPASMAGFCSMRAMSTRNDDPLHSSRPFDLGRDGFVMGEGSTILVLETLEHAKARGAKIHGEILGAGMTGDAHHMTAPHPEGLGARRAMEKGIADAGLKLEQIGYVNMHGTSTDLGDIAETKAIRSVFGDHANKILCNSTKSMTGHLLGAAGAMELAVVLKSLEDQVIHPTINLQNQDPQCDLDYVANTKRAHSFEYAISNSFGFGGHNVTLVAGRFQE